MLVPPPGLFSITTCWPQIRDSRSAVMRDRVGRSARRIRDDNAHGAGWPVLRHRWTAHRGRKRERRGERPRSCGAANRGYEFSPIDMDCHGTLRWGVIPVQWRNDITL